MPERPLFSVVIPTYDRRERVLAAIRSVLRQTEPGFECFVVDDGSKDGTAEALKSLSDPRLRVLLNGANRGQHACRNQAIRAAGADWICFLDSDDVYLPDRLAELRRAIAREPEVGFWFTNAYVHRYGRIIGTLFDPARAIPRGRVPGYYAVGDAYLPYVTSVVCVRRRAFQDVGFFREDLRILEDTELYARMLKSGLPVGALNQPLAVRFLHEGQITHDYRKDFVESMEALKAAEAPPEVSAGVRRRVACEVASYLWKSGQPAAARELLRREAGGRPRSLPLYWRTFLPSPLLAPLRGLRRLYLRARYHPLLVTREFREAQRVVGSLVEPA